MALVEAALADVEEVGDCGDSICSGVKLPSEEPSLECEEGGVKGKP